MAETKKGFFAAFRGGLKSAAAAYSESGSIGMAAGALWSFTTTYFLPNKQKYQVDGGRYGANYTSITQIEQAQEFAIAITAIATTVGCSDWKILLKPSEAAEATPLTNQNLPVLKLLRNPNGLHAWQSWIETAVLLLIPTGNLYILKDPLSMLGTPMALWILRSDRTRPIRGDQPTAPVQAYEHYAEDGTRYVFPPDRVIHIKLPNPYTDYQGLGMVQLLQQSLEMDFRSMESNIQMFRQGGNLSTVLEGGADDPEKAREIKAKINEIYTGSANAHRVLILTGDMKLAKNGGAPKETDYKQTREDISRGIGGMLGVPPMFMGHLGDINYSTATVQERMFLKRAVWPMMTRLTPALNAIVQIFDRRLTFEWPRVDVMDPETVWRTMEAAVAGGVVTPNDAREKFLQMPRVKDPAMDKHYVQGVGYALEDGPPAPQMGLATNYNVVDEVQKGQRSIDGARRLLRLATLGSKALTDKDGRPFPKGTQAQRRVLGAIRAARPKIEKAIAPVFEKHIKAFAKKAADEVESRKGGKALTTKTVHPFIGSIFKAYDDSGTPEGLKTDALEAYKEQAVVVAADAQGIFNIEMGLEAGSADVSVVAAQLAQRVGWMDQSLKDRLAQLIVEGTEKGLSPYELANGTADGTFAGIRASFDDMAQEHAMLIARTETAHLQDAINTEAYKLMGVKVCDVIGCEDFVIMPGETYGCNSQGVPVTALPINFHPNHNGAVVPAEV